MVIVVLKVVVLKESFMDSVFEPSYKRRQLTLELCFRCIFTNEGDEVKHCLQ